MLILHKIRNAKTASSYITQKCLISYTQGQEPEPNVREYFYFIDHQGMLFLDDARTKNFTSCFKDKKFLHFFFTRTKFNNTGRYRDSFPFLSVCGRERNFVRCDDLPFVFTHVIQNKQSRENHLSYCHAGDLLTVKFIPEKIYMSPKTGRVYHPAPEKVGGIGLIQSKLAIEFSKHFVFDAGEQNPPTRFVWNDKEYVLDKNWYKNCLKYIKKSDG